MKTRLILDINKTQYAQLNSLVTGRVGDKVSNVVDVYVIDGGSPYNLTGLKVFFECAKPDNTFVRDNNGVKIIDAAQGHFEYTFPTQTFGFAGRAKRAFFSIEKDSTVRATTQDFELVTLADAQTNRIPSETYISELDELISEAADMVDRASGSPKGVYATLDALKSALPNGSYGIYIVSDDGNWYYWKNNTWTAGGLYQSTGIANNAINFEKRYIPEVQLINQNAVEVNYKTRTITVGKGCFISTEKYIFNIAPNQTINVPFPASDSVLYLLLYNYKTGELYCKPFNEAGGSDLSIISFYQKKIYGQSASNVSYISDNDNYDYLTERRINVFTQNIKTDAVDYTKIRMYEALIISKDRITLDKKNKKLIIKPGLLATIGDVIFNLNQTNQVITFDVPQDNYLYAFVFDISSGSYNLSIELYSGRAKLNNKRLLFYIYKNTIFGSNEQYISIVNAANKKSIKEQFSAHLKSPFKKTKIKTIGDSKTAGVGGTGFSPTGDPIGNTGFKMNVDTAVCWANMLKKHIESVYKKETFVNVTHPEIQYLSATYTVMENTASINKWQVRFNNTSVTPGFSFNFYGDHFRIIYAQTDKSGIVDIYVDGVKFGSLNGFGTYQENAYFDVSGLALGNHFVEIKETNTKDSASGGYSFFFQGLRIPKTATVRNYGISGNTSNGIYHQLDQLIEADDDIIILQIGTNDRNIYDNPDITRAFIKKIIEYVQAKDKLIFIMSANPVRKVNDEDNKKFKMRDVNDAIQQVANEFYNGEYISNYDGFIDFMLKTGSTLESLLNDDLHPNDKGYKVYFNYIAKCLGLSLSLDEIQM
ncbi:BppU family phage baseplate upper protein [Bacillus paranthracis]|uniref:BppU family phage baseplate upper protein n=1 Tax=Bacillus paranthracis TaxID=2026186 RepID=UPI003BA87720